MASTHGPHSHDPAATTRVALTRSAWTLFLVVGAVVGGLVGAWLDDLTSWLDGRSWVPTQDLVSALADHADDVGTPWRVAAAAVVGVALAALAASQATAVEVDADQLVVVKGVKRQRWSRVQVAGVVLSGRTLALRDDRDADLAQETIDGDPTRLREALERHSWPLR